jgi:plastocyanin
MQFLGMFSFAESPANKTVVIENMKFSPGEISAKPGEIITWKNNDLVPHTVTALNKSFDSKMIEPGKTWVLKAPQKGTYPYKCDFHPVMSAKLLVK